MKKKYSLTFPQQNIWLVNNLYNSSKPNLIVGVININEEFNVENCRKSINYIIKNNDAMRIKVDINNDIPYQIVQEYEYQNIHAIDMSKYTKEEIEKFINNYKEEEIYLLNDKLFEFKILIYKNKKGAVLLKMHHIISDAWSYSKIIEQFTTYYTALKNNDVICDNKYPSYTNFVEAMLEYSESEKYLKDEKFWSEYLNGYEEKVAIKETTKKITNISNRYNVKLEEGINNRIINYCKENKISPYVMFLTALSTYIYRVREKDDFVIGTPSLNRSNFKEKQMIGMFVSTLPLRIKVEKAISFLELAKAIAKDTMSLFRHQRYPYINTLKYVRNNNNLNENLYSILLSYQNARAPFENTDMYNTKWYKNNYQNEDLQIHILDMDSTGIFEINYDYLSELFTEEEIKYLHTRLLAIIENAISVPDIDIENIKIMSQKEEEEILCKFNNTNSNYIRDKSVIDLFESQVDLTPDSIALVFEDKKLTYRQLNEKANSLAHYLVNKNQIKAGDIVGIKFQRSIEMIVAILAVAKTRATYLPIDPTFPEDRINYIKNNSKLKLVLEDISKADYSKKDNLNLSFRIDDPFYILYTSGSTGNPKGVVITNKNIMNFAYGINKVININKLDSVLSITTVSFDIFELELWIPIINGAKIILANDKEKLNPYLLNKLCIKNKVNVIQTTTSVYSSLIYDEKNAEFFKYIDKVLIGGEKVTVNVTKKLKQISSATIFNVYGPTETTIWSSVGVLKDTDDINAGSPIANTKILILDKNFRMLPLGIPGQLYISGDGVAKGYLYNENLTSKAFHNILGGRWYSTGDLAYINQDLNLKILDRIDLQVKINGRRIEIEEIEKVIYNTGLVSNVVVILKGNKLVCVYKGKIDNIEKFKNDISKLLPFYMIPSAFYELEKFPMTENKKVNRKKIQSMEFESDNKKVTLAENHIEMYLSKKIASYLNIDDKIDINTDLFGLGVDSLNIMRLVNDINTEYNINIVSNSLLDNPSIRQIAKMIGLKIDSFSNDIANKMNMYEEKEMYELTNVQKSIYTEYLKDKNSILYNLPFEITINEKIDVERLKESIKIAINNHDILFSSIVEKENNIYYKINKESDFKIECPKINFDEYKKEKGKFVSSFDLKNGPLFRIKMYQVEDSIKLMFDFSHLIVDGYSVSIILQDISDCYNKGSITKEKISFGNCINLRNINDEDKKFYFDKFELNNSGKFNVNETKIKKDKNSNNKKGSKVYFDFSKSGIEEYCKKNNVTINNFVFGVFNIVLSYITKNHDITIGLTSIGRNLAADSNTVGMFVNTIPFRIKIDNNLKFKELLEILNEEVNLYVKHQNYNYFELYKDINNISRTKNFLNVLYSFQGSGMPKLNIKNVNYNIEEIPTYTSKFDFTFEVVINEESINYNLEYSFGYSKNTVYRLLNMLYEVTKYIIRSNTDNISDIIYFMKDMLFSQEYSNTQNSDIVYKKISDTKNNYYMDDKEVEILNIYKEILNNDEITVNDDFFEIGGDSLLVMNLVSKLNNIGINVIYSDLFKYKTVDSLYKHVYYYENRYFIDKNVSNYDYTNIEKLLEIKGVTDNLSKKEIENVLLVGPTGFLGMHVLNELYDNNVQNIYCVIRQKDNIAVEKRFYNLLEFYFGKDKANKIINRVTLVKADVTIANSIESALSKEQISKLELVINCAARVKHYGDEIKFMAVNVDAVSNLINLCVNNDIELAHVSTLSVSGDFIGGGQKIEGVDHVIFDEKALFINQDLDNIYAYTKFISEKMVFDAIINKNLKAKVLRVGNLTGRYDDGKFQKNISENAFVSRIETLVNLKIIPSNILDLYIEMTPVDYAAKAIFKICTTNVENPVYHIYNLNHIPIVKLLELLRKVDIDIKVISKDKLKKIITEYLRKDPSLINGIIMDINEENTIDYHSNIIIKSDYTIDLLKKLGFEWPKVDNEYFYKFLNYLKKYGNFKN